MTRKKTTGPKVTKTLRVGAFQFRACESISKNTTSILRGMRKASARGVKLLSLQECALTGYAPVERKDTASIDTKELKAAEKKISECARELDLWVSLGTTSFAKKEATNSLRLISPAGRTACLYHKRAMYGSDENFYSPRTVGNNGICKIEGHTVGLRICFEFRFPEYFRELLKQKAKLAIMGFCMTGTGRKFETARAHLISRAAENGMWIVAANSISNNQDCPTAIIAPDGTVIKESPRNREHLIVHDLDLTAPTGLPADIRRMALGLKNRRHNKNS